MNNIINVGVSLMCFAIGLHCGFSMELIAFTVGIILIYVGIYQNE